MKKSGFTLIELMVVVVIIGVMTAAAAPNFYRNYKRSQLEKETSSFSFLLGYAYQYNHLMKSPIVIKKTNIDEFSSEVKLYSAYSKDNRLLEVYKKSGTEIETYENKSIVPLEAVFMNPLKIEAKIEIKTSDNSSWTSNSTEYIIIESSKKYDFRFSLEDFDIKTLLNYSKGKTTLSYS